MLAGAVGFLLQGFALDLQLDQAAVDFVQGFGLGIHGHAHAAGGLIDQVDGLVGQEAVGDVAVRQGGCGDDCRVGNADPVVDLVLFLQAAQDRDGVLDRRLGHHDRLETPGQGRVLFNVFSVLIQRRGPDAMQLAARQGGLQEVGGIHSPVGLAGPDQSVHLVDEQDDLTFGGGDLVQHGFQPLLELAAIFGPGNQGPHVQAHHLLVAQGFGHIAVDDAQGQALDDGGLADAGLTDEDGIVLGAPGQDLDGATDLLVAADDRVDLAVGSRQGQVAGIAIERIIAVFGPGAVGGLALAQLIDGGVQLVGRDARGGQDGLGDAALLSQGLEQALGRDELVAGLFRGLFGGGEDAGGVAVEIELAGAALDLGAFGQRGFDVGQGAFGVAAGGGDQVTGQAVAFLQEHLQKVLGRELLMAARERQRLGRLDGGFGPVGILVKLQGVSLREADGPV